MSRRRARKQAFLTLYQSDVTGAPLEDVLERWRSYRGELEGYAEDLTQGVREKCEDLDRMLSEAAVGWPVVRMSAIDRTIMRLALYEMLFSEDVPPDVAINEAIELAKGFSGDEAPAFVGGVLRGVQGAGRESAQHG